MGGSALWTVGGHHSGTSTYSPDTPQKQRISIWVSWPSFKQTNCKQMQPWAMTGRQWAQSAFNIQKIFLCISKSCTEGNTWAS